MHVKVDVYSGLAFAMLIFGMSGIETAEKFSAIKESWRNDYGYHGHVNHFLVKPGVTVNHTEVF